jgi:hypothetical protein
MGGERRLRNIISIIFDRLRMRLTLVGPATGLVIPAQDPVDMGGGRIDEQTEDESPDVMTVSPKVDIDGDEDGEDGEPPTNTLNDESVTSVGELIDEITE